MSITEKDDWVGFKKRPLIDFSDGSLYALNTETKEKEFIARYPLGEMFSENIDKKVQELQDSWR